MIEVYGYSDDLIEIEGAVQEEFEHYEEGPGYITFDDGTVLAVAFDPDSTGQWRISVHTAGTGQVTIAPPTGGEDDYTDRATVTGATTVRYSTTEAEAKPRTPYEDLAGLVDLLHLHDTEFGAAQDQGIDRLPGARKAVAALEEVRAFLAHYPATGGRDCSADPELAVVARLRELIGA